MKSNGVISMNALSTSGGFGATSRPCHGCGRYRLTGMRQVCARSARIPPLGPPQQGRPMTILRILVLLCAAGIAASGQEQTRRVYVTALDASGIPIDGLTADDFTAKEG